MDRDELILENLNLIYFVINKMELSDFTEYYYDDGLYGLVKAANIYDPETGYTFSTVATKCIQREIMTRIRRDSADIRKANLNTVSLDSVVNLDSTDDELTLLDLISSDYDLEEEVIQNEQKEELSKAILQLKEREMLLLQYLYYDELTEKEIAKIFGNSQSNISRMKINVIKKLRKILKVDGDDGCNK